MGYHLVYKTPPFTPRHVYRETQHEQLEEALQAAFATLREIGATNGENDHRAILFISDPHDHIVMNDEGIRHTFNKSR